MIIFYQICSILYTWITLYISVVKYLDYNFFKCTCMCNKLKFLKCVFSCVIHVHPLISMEDFESFSRKWRAVLFSKGRKWQIYIDNFQKRQDFGWRGFGFVQIMNRAFPQREMIMKIHWQLLKIFSRTTGPISTKLGKWYKTSLGKGI